MLAHLKIDQVHLARRIEKDPAAKHKPPAGESRTPLGTFWKNTFFHFLAIFEHSRVQKRYQTSHLSVTRHLKRIRVFDGRSL